MQNNKPTIILFYTKENSNTFTTTLNSVNSLSPAEILILNSTGNALDIMPDSAVSIDVSENDTLGKQLNAAFDEASTQNYLLIDNRANAITLKQGSLELFELASGRSDLPGMVYADYEIQKDGKTDDVRLLKHHIGRVRDNQDYGKVFYIPKSALEIIDFADASLKFTTLYDLRLKLSQQHDLIHVANRYAGSLYSVETEGSSQNVFDYLLASKESQIEAEKVLSSHLKAIDAYLAPQQYYTPRPASSGAKLKASVIIPVNNRPEFISSAIESVQAQTVKEVEVIVVINGGNDDPTVAAVAEYMEGGAKYDSTKPTVRSLVYNINNLGLCLNMGAQVAEGEFYVQLDSDDRLKADAVEKILAVYEEDPNIGMVIGSYEVWEKQENGEVTRMESLPVITHDEWTEDNGRNNLLRINGAGAPRSIPIELIRQVGFSVNEEPHCRNYGEDYGMVLKLSEQHKIGRVWDAIYDVIRHSGGTDHNIDQTTVDRNDEAKDFMRAEAIERRLDLND